MQLVRAASEAGCDAVEIGIPFSDPIADGPLIQESSKAALDAGMTLDRSLQLADRISKEITTPLVFMGYYNPILNMGAERFADAAVANGVTGVIVPDLSFEESSAVRTKFDAAGLTYIDLLAPTSSDDRVAAIADAASGFVYLVSVTGVTGVKSATAGELAGFVDRVAIHTDLPLYVGFGISGPERAAETARICDGVIIGSALIREIQAAASGEEAVERVATFLSNVRAAIDA